MHTFIVQQTITVSPARNWIKTGGISITIYLFCSWQCPAFRTNRFCCCIQITTIIRSILVYNRSSTGDSVVANLVTYGTSGKECWGNSNGWGPAYENSCIHSGTIASSGDLPTNWYNYTLATAGTIIDEDTTSSNPATNTNRATESVCPKGWTLPDKAQTRSIGPNAGSDTYVSSFSPVLGGNYYNGTLQSEATYGNWWGSEAYVGAARYRLYYNGSSLYTGTGYRLSGYYIRCVQAP